MAATQQRVAAILGPTASGKTALAVALFERGLNIEIIGCDALQLYRGMEIGTATPSAALRARVPHHAVACLDASERLDAARYCRLADAAIADVIGRGKRALLVGGTGLYHRALTAGLVGIPAVPAAVRAELGQRWLERGPDAMHAELAGVDPAYAAKTPATNRQRILRALEVHRATGRSFSAWHADHDKLVPRYRCLNIVLQPPRAALIARIEPRAAAMVEGIVAETHMLLAAGVSPEAHALQAIGYRDAARRLVAGEDLDMRALTAALVRAHKSYAKRQATWFAQVKPALIVTDADATAPAADERVAAGLQAHFAGE